MKKSFLAFFTMLFVCFPANAQKVLMGVNPGDENNNPAIYFGNITQYDINGENPAILHEFDSIHGCIPKGKLLMASNGKLYGTTIKGGATGTQVPHANAGVLFEYDLILDQYTVIHYFGSDSQGFSIPDIGVIEPTPGTLVGATYNRIFKYEMATGNITFSNPLGFLNGIHGELMKASDGNIYGTSYYGFCPAVNPVGPYYGNIIKYNMAANTVGFVSPIGCDNITNGWAPSTQLIETSPGILLGTTRNGGFGILSDPFKGGTLLEINIGSNTITRKIDFNYATSGVYPQNLTAGGNGKVYGLCEEGGAEQACNPSLHLGTLYEYTPSTNTLEVKQNFSFCGNSVRYPSSLMKTSNGHFMGTIPAGGLFKYDAATNEITMPNYTSSNINLYNAANLIEICRKPAYHFFDVDTFDGCLGNAFTYDVQNTNATSYQWIKDGFDVPGQTSGILNLPSLTASDAGNYTCLMTNPCGSTTTMVLHFTVNCLGTNTVADFEKSVTLYPNPATNWINVALPENINVTITGCTLTNLLGQTIYPDFVNNKIDVSQLQKGIYIVSLQTNYGKWNGKFVKE